MDTIIFAGGFTVGEVITYGTFFLLLIVWSDLKGR